MTEWSKWGLNEVIILCSLWVVMTLFLIDWQLIVIFELGSLGSPTPNPSPLRGKGTGRRWLLWRRCSAQIFSRSSRDVFFWVHWRWCRSLWIYPWSLLFIDICIIYLHLFTRWLKWETINIQVPCWMHSIIELSKLQFPFKDLSELLHEARKTQVAFNQEPPQPKHVRLVMNPCIINVSLFVICHLFQQYALHIQCYIFTLGSHISSQISYWADPGRFLHLWSLVNSSALLQQQRPRGG